MLYTRFKRCFTHNMIVVLALIVVFIFGLIHTDKPSINRPDIDRSITDANISFTEVK